MMNHVTWLALQIPQRDLVMALLRVRAITTRKTTTGEVMEATKPMQQTSRMNQMNINPTHCWKSRVGESYHIGLTTTADEGEAFLGSATIVVNWATRGVTVKSH